MEKYYFFKEDLLELSRQVRQLHNRIIEMGKEQAEVAGQSTENFGHDDACQEVIEHDRKIILKRLDELSDIINKAELVDKSINKSTDVIKFGSKVELNNGNVFIIGSYRVLVNHEIKNISYASPLAKKLLGKSEGDLIKHNNNVIKIIKVS